MSVAQARKAAALAEQYAPSDADAEAKLEREAREEERAILQTCDELGVRMVEVHVSSYSSCNRLSLIYFDFILDKSRRPLPVLRCCRPTCRPRHRTTRQSHLSLHPSRRSQLHTKPHG